ncbi:MAG: hypothetical protein OEU92_14685 [Alphaproteobacteria bacterium]|nr:hypothetical protein [Alphaproteobacteria bacterium]
MLRVAVSVMLATILVSGCTNIRAIEGKHEHEASETLFSVGYNKNGEITTVTGYDGKPIEGIDRTEHDAFVEEKRQQDPDSVKVVEIKDPPDQIVFHPGSQCHDMSSGGTTWQECH